MNKRARSALPVGSAASKETVLVVDDDARIRVLIRTILARQDYEVLEAEDGQAAYELLQRLSGRVELVITDVQMPRMDGFALARKVAAEYPHIRMLYVSGFVSGLEEMPSGPLLRKPVTPAGLMEAVRKRLTA